MQCPLCHSAHHQLFYKDRLHHFFSCRNCGGLFRPDHNIPNADAEKARYQTHNNDVNDPGYRNFVRPLVDYVKKHYPKPAKGLDYGAGTGPVIAVMLEEDNYKLALYDPFFHPDRTPLSSTYDFIICCEVMEHFHKPDEEFPKLKALLKPGGSLLCKTDLHHPEINFEKWYYKNDPTHVFIYTKDSCHWIAKHFGFELEFIDDRSPVFKLPA